MPRVRLLPIAARVSLVLRTNNGCRISALNILLQARDAIASADAAAAAASPCISGDALKEAHEEALADAEVLLSHAMCIPRHSLRLSLPKLHVQQSHAASFSRFVALRCSGTPVPYITRSRHFHDHEFFVTPDVLIPRPETEVLVDRALHLARALPPSSQCGGAAFTFVDLGCGSGTAPIPP